jgi:hypothetical protein
VPVRRAVVVLLLASALFVAANARAEDDVSAPTAPGVQADVQARPPEPPRRTTYSGFLSGGAALRRLFSLPLDTGVVGLGFGADFGHVGLNLLGDYERGRADRGLQLSIVRVGVSGEGVFGRFRMGVGLDLSNVTVLRVTDGSTINRFGAGLFATTSLDVVRFDALALYLGLRGDLDLSAAVKGGSLALGFRL